MIVPHCVFEACDIAGANAQAKQSENGANPPLSAPREPPPQRATDKSVVSYSGKARIFQRGGARARHGKASNCLADKDARRLLQAMLAAKGAGVPLNRFITIHWERAGVASGDTAKATRAYLKYARDMLARRCLPFAYVWLIESDDGDGSKGHHAHILAHVPAGASLGRLQRGWLGKITGKQYVVRVIHTRTIGGHVCAATAAPAHYQANLAAVACYVLKGASKATAQMLGLPRWHEGGRIAGQRMGVSRNLSRLARPCPIAR